MAVLDMVLDKASELDMERELELVMQSVLD
jgi:hypothetical protein